jgi:hypothetical protein
VSKSHFSASDEILDKFFRKFFSVPGGLSNQHEEVRSSGSKIVPRIFNHGTKGEKVAGFILQKVYSYERTRITHYTGKFMGFGTDMDAVVGRNF